MILIIDDDMAVRSSLGLLLRRARYETAMAEGPEDALAFLRASRPDLIILDMNFTIGTSGEEGLSLLGRIKSAHPGVPVVLITAWGSIPLAVQGMKAGAADFITKPWNNDRLLQSVRTALSLSRPGEVRGDISAPDRLLLSAAYNFDNIIGENSALLSMLAMAGRVSATDAPVLIIGESGTGKELIAEAIHSNSERRNGPFVKVNLGGIPASLFEAEMFGHKRGAFTSAVRDRIGRFELADGGTIFLDEIGDLDVASQVKLLRVLQDRTFEVVGASRSTTVDFRLLCATNRDLDELIAAGQFREDLYYRINLITLKIPPLRERRADIPLLTAYFVENLKTIYHRPNLTVDGGAMRWLSDLPWPGNVRELKNLVERTVLVSAGDRLNAEDFQSQLGPLGRPAGEASLPAVGTMTIEAMEVSMIRKALEFHGSNLTKVARSLGLSRAALYRRMEKHGITV